MDAKERRFSIALFRRTSSFRRVSPFRLASSFQPVSSFRRRPESMRFRLAAKRSVARNLLTDSRAPIHDQSHAELTLDDLHTTDWTSVKDWP